MTQRIRAYTGNLPYVAGLLQSARRFMHTDVPGIERQLWEQDTANEAIKASLATIRADLADMQAFVREIEATLTTVEEEQNAAKETHRAA